MTRIASRLFVVTALAIAAYAAYTASLTDSSSDAPSADPAPPLVIAQPDQDLGLIPVGTHQIIFRIENPSDQPRQVLGSAGGGCNPTCCFYSRQDRLIPIPPLGEVGYVCHLDVSHPGPFENAMTLNLEENGFRSVKVTVRGTAVAVEGGPNGSSKP